MAYAVPPVSYDGWSVSSGAVTATCPTGVTCSDTIGDSGFMVRKLVVPRSVNASMYGTFFQYIVTEPGASGRPTAAPFAAGSLRFATEQMIQTGGTESKVFSRTRIADSRFTTPTLEDRLYQLNDFENGTAGVGSSTIQNSFVQELRQIDWSGTTPVELMYSLAKASGTPEYYDIFSSAVPSGTPDIAKNKSWLNSVITQSMNLGDGGVQKFQKQKDSTPLAHTANPLNPLLPGGTNGGDFSLSPMDVYPEKARETLATTWVGQKLATATGDYAQFGYTDFSKRLLSAYPYGWPGLMPVGTVQTSLTSLSSANPVVNINTYFTPGSYFNISPNINAPAALITPVAWTLPAPLSGTIAAVTPPAAGGGAGGPPIAFGNWTVNNGVITPAACPTGMQCGAGISGAGFLQREVTAADGGRYFQTIVTDTAATGNPNTAANYAYTYRGTTTNPWDLTVGALTYADENFVRPGVNGLASKQQMTEVVQTATGRTAVERFQPFNYSVKLTNGWAQGAASNPVFQVDQQIIHGTYGEIEKVHLIAAADGSKDYSILSIPSSYRYSTDFYTHIVQGSLQATSHTASVASPLLPGGSNGGNIGWQAGESLQGTWVGAFYETPGGLASMGNTAFTNLTTGEQTSLNYVLLTSSPDQVNSAYLAGPRVPYNSPVSWPSPLGPPNPPTIVRIPGTTWKVVSN